MIQKALILSAFLALTLVTYTLFEQNPVKPELKVSKQRKLSCVRREDMINRARGWMNKPYTQTVCRDGYRCDCSGLVSFAWVVPKPGATTYTMMNHARAISKNELQQGDAILCDGHTALFWKWADAGKTSYTALECASTKSGCLSRNIPYPMWSGSTGCKPIRSKTVC